MSDKESDELVEVAIGVLTNDPMVGKVEGLLKELFKVESYTPGLQKGFFMASLTTMHNYINLVGKVSDLRKEMLEIQDRLDTMLVQKKLKNKDIINRVVDYMDGTDY